MAEVAPWSAGIVISTQPPPCNWRTSPLGGRGTHGV